jgi:hypothetical protein
MERDEFGGLFHPLANFSWKRHPILVIPTERSERRDLQFSPLATNAVPNLLTQFCLVVPTEEAEGPAVLGDHRKSLSVPLLPCKCSSAHWRLARRTATITVLLPWPDQSRPGGPGPSLSPIR